MKRRSEQAVFAAIIAGIIIFGLGSSLYLRKAMVQLGIDWELQLAVFGVFIIVLAIVVAVFLSKVE